MKHQKNKRLGIYRLTSASVVAVSLLASFGWLADVNAATTPFQQSFVRLDNMNALTATSGRVCFKPSTANQASTVASVAVTFPTTSSGTDFTVNTTAANWTVTTTGLDSGQTALPNVATASSVSGKTVTFPLSTAAVLSASNLYCFNFGGTNTLTNSSAGAPISTATLPSIVTQASGPTPIDTSYYSESIITNDQVVIQNAVVPPSFQFTLSGNTDAFTGNLVPNTVVATSGKTITIVTNAASGWIVWAQDLAANAKAGLGSLASATANYKIGGTSALGAASHTLTSEDYGMGVTVVTNGSASAAAASSYDGTSSKAGSLDPGAYYPIATASNPTNTDVIQMQELARSSATTPAASDYTDTISFVGAGKF
jgi:hypothetical protein